MKERSLVFFTLLMQASTGTCLGLLFIELTNPPTVQAFARLFNVGWLAGFLLAAVGLLSSFFHLKLPLHAWRGIANVKTSWLSREILFASIFTGSMFVVSLLQLCYSSTGIVSPVKWIALISGLAMIFCMGSAYRLNTTKFWNSPQTIVSFYTSAFIFCLLISGVLGFIFVADETIIPFLLNCFGWILAILILLKLFISYNGYIRLTSGKSELFKKIKKLLLVQFSFGILAAILAFLLLFVNQQVIFWLIWPVVVFTVLSELFGRVLFYEAQVPYGVYLLKI